MPPSLAHGFVVLFESADFLYKTTDYYALQFECGVRWDDTATALHGRWRSTASLRRCW